MCICRNKRNFFNWLKLLHRTSVSGGCCLVHFRYSWRFFAVLPETFSFPLVVSCVKGDVYNSGIKEDQRGGESKILYVMHVFDCNSYVITLFCVCPHILPKFLYKSEILNPASCLGTTLRQCGWYRGWRSSKSVLLWCWTCNSSFCRAYAETVPSGVQNGTHDWFSLGKKKFKNYVSEKSKPSNSKVY